MIAFAKFSLSRDLRLSPVFCESKVFIKKLPQVFQGSFDKMKFFIPLTLCHHFGVIFIKVWDGFDAFVKIK